MSRKFLSGSFRLTEVSPVSVSPFTKAIILREALPKCYFSRRKTQNIDLFFFEGSTCCFFAVICAAALDIHMVRITLIVRVINAFVRLTVNADRLAWTVQGIHIGIPLTVTKTIAASLIRCAGTFAAYGNISLAAAPVAVVGTVFHGTT